MDDAGNRLTQTHTGTSTGPTQYQFTYDFEGNLLTKTNAGAQLLLSINWNAKNQPKNLSALGKSNSFIYDPNGYRVAKTDSLGNKTYLLENEHLEAVYSGQSLIAKFLRGSVIDEVVTAFQYDSNGVWTNTTYHHDQETSVIGLSGHSGEVYNLTAYAPFGEIVQEAGPITNFLKYTGREQDPDSGLYQYRARYYDPTIGRFISEDPTGFAGSGVNWYAYVGNNPTNANDPSGLDAFTLGGSFNILGVGGSLGAFITFPGPKTKDNFDIGIFGSVTAPGFPLSYLIKKTVNPNYPDLPPSLNIGRLTIDVGYEFDGRASLGGTGVNFNGGAGFYGGAVNLQTPAQDVIPISGFQVNVGPQLRFGPEITQTGTYSIGDIFQDIVFPAFDAAKGLFSPSAPSPQIQGNNSNNFFGNANGGFVLYPNKANQNMTRSVYAK